MKPKKWVVATTVVSVLIGTSIFLLTSNMNKSTINGVGYYTVSPHEITNGQAMVSFKTVAETFNHRVAKDSNANMMVINYIEDEIISEMNDIKIMGKKSNRASYEQLHVVTNQFSRILSGYNVTNPTYAPEIISTDLNRDGNHEIAVILTTGYGTGVYHNELILMDENTGEDIPVEDASSVFKNNKNGFSPSEWGSILCYSIEDNHLKASTSVQIAPNEFVGELVTYYEYVNGTYIAGTVIFVPNAD
ncbi:hypothetical protein [Paenibacillus sp. CMAA1364]